MNNKCSIYIFDTTRLFYINYLVFCGGYSMQKNIYLYVEEFIKSQNGLQDEINQLGIGLESELLEKVRVSVDRAYLDMMLRTIKGHSRLSDEDKISVKKWYVVA